jgi:hypothetical protein
LAQGYNITSEGWTCGESVVVVVVEVEVEVVSPSIVVDVVDEVGTVEEVDAVGSVVVGAGTVVVGGRIVSPGATVFTGSEVGVVSPEAERFVVVLEHEASRSPTTTKSAAPLVAKRRCRIDFPFMIASVALSQRRRHDRRLLHAPEPYAPPAPRGRRCWWRKVRDSNPR